MKKQLLRFPLLLSAAVFILSSCKKDNDDHNHEEHEEEVITTLQLNFAPVGGGNTVTYKYDDVDGPGGNNPIQDQIVLAPNKTYNVSLQLLNKTVTPPGGYYQRSRRRRDSAPLLLRSISGQQHNSGQLE